MKEVLLRVNTTEIGSISNLVGAANQRDLELDLQYRLDGVKQLSIIISGLGEVNM